MEVNILNKILYIDFISNNIKIHGIKNIFELVQKFVDCFKVNLHNYKAFKQCLTGVLHHIFIYSLYKTIPVQQYILQFIIFTMRKTFYGHVTTRERTIIIKYV